MGEKGKEGVRRVRIFLGACVSGTVILTQTGMKAIEAYSRRSWGARGDEGEF